MIWFAALTAPAHAQNATAALTEASKHLESGVPVKAIEIINKTLGSDKLSSELAAKALLLRARAQEKLEKYAYALADYNQALWMDGLSDGDKSEAESGRARILAKLGVEDGKKQKTASAQPAQPKVRQKNIVTIDDWNSQIQSTGTQVQTSASEEKTGGIGGFFEGIFGSQKTKEEPKRVAQAKPQPQPQPQIAPKRAVAAQPVSTAPRVEVAAATPSANTVNENVVNTAASAPAPSSEPTGDFAIQFAALRNEDGAIYEVDRIEKRYGEWLGGRTPSITIRPTSEGGTLYKIIAEPYERGEGTATCELLKTKGSDCMLISR